MSPRYKQCPFCEERPSALPNGSCTECAMDEQLDQWIVNATKRADSLGLSFERFIELCECAWDVTDMDLPSMMASADVFRLRNKPKTWVN